MLFQTIVIRADIEIHVINIYKEYDISLTTFVVNEIAPLNGVHHIVMGVFNLRNVCGLRLRMEEFGKILLIIIIW